MLRISTLLCLVLIALPHAFGPLRPSSAHDTWLEAGPLRATAGQFVYVDLMLGNHGNEHRDFRLASKISLAPVTLTALAPSGQSIDLKPLLIDMGSAEKEGYWTARCDLPETGLYEFVHTLDTLHGTIRAIKSAKTYVISQSPDKPVATTQHRDPAPLGHGLELVLRSPVAELKAGQAIALQVLRAGKPLPAARVSFIPRGTTLQSGFDPAYERTSDEQGHVHYVPDRGNVILAIAHHVAANESGANYERTHYSAAIVLPVSN